jgi:hypothetical protein
MSAIGLIRSPIRRIERLARKKAATLLEVCVFSRFFEVVECHQNGWRV